MEFSIILFLVGLGLGMFVGVLAGNRLAIVLGAVSTILALIGLT